MWWQQMFGLDRQGWSDLAGSASFVVWLFAQSPQLYENYCNSSCEGLSVVFLAQWMAGDVTNLVGCVLTQQMPFQIAVATYFCSIDLCILVQYYYYWRRDRLVAQRRKTGEGRPIYRQYPSMTAPNMRSSSSHASLSRVNRDLSPTPSTSLHQQERGQVSRTTSRPTLKYYAYRHGSTHSYRALSQAARSVADLADEYARRVAKRDASKHFRHQKRSKSDKQSALKAKLATLDGNNIEGNEDDNDDNDEVPAQMVNSVLSDSSSSGDFGYGFGTASTVLDPARKEEAPSPLISPTLGSRGRDMTRTAGKMLALSSSRSPAEPSVAAVADDSSSRVEGAPSAMSFVPLTDAKANNQSAQADHEETGRRSSSRHDGRLSLRRTESSRSTRSPIANRGTGMVLLGLTALYALQWQAKSSDLARKEVSFTTEGRGSVLSWAEPDATRLSFDEDNSDHRILHYLPLARAPDYRRHRHHHHHHHSTPPPPPPPVSWQRVIGRVSAWICTVLYMTSRLPQIWTNLSRKSVQGLSILLFLSAALGNGLYSISVLANPLAVGDTRAEYILESLPFLLGSGGTLVFDAIIVCQWLAWRGNAPIEEVVPAYSAAAATTVSTSIPTHYTYRSSSRVGHHHTAATNTASNRWASLERQPLLDSI